MPNTLYLENSIIRVDKLIDQQRMFNAENGILPTIYFLNFYMSLDSKWIIEIHQAVISTACSSMSQIVTMLSFSTAVVPLSNL